MKLTFKVCMLITKFYPVLGGVEYQALKLARCMVQRDIPVTVVTRNYNGSPTFESIDGIQVYRTPLLGKSISKASISYLSLGMAWLIQHHGSYDILHCHQITAPVTLGVLAKKLFKGKKVIAKVTSSGQLSEAAAIERLPFSKLRKQLLRSVDTFVSINPKIGEELRYIGINQERIVNIPNGVDIPLECAYQPIIKQKYRALLGLDYQNIVLFVGRLCAEKNLDILLHAWKQTTQKHPNAHLLILGEGGAFRNVEAEIRQLAIDLQLSDTVHFLGRINDVNSYLLAGDIFALPSSTEGMSNALLEAMAAGNGIVASNIPGNAQLISDGINGLLVPPGGVASLSLALNRLLENSALTATLGKAAKQSAIENFSIDSVADRYIKLYTELLAVNGLW